jgi:hypothetical protein
MPPSPTPPTGALHPPGLIKRLLGSLSIFTMVMTIHRRATGVSTPRHHRYSRRAMANPEGGPTI